MTRLEQIKRLMKIRLGDEPVYAEDLAPPKPKPKPKPKKKRRFLPSSEPSQGRLQYAATAVKRLRNA